MGLFLDIADLTECQTDLALDFICKAQSDDSLTEAIFDEHPSPFIRRLIELFYERGLLRLTDFRDELGRWLDGSLHQAGPLPHRPDGAMLRWTPAELQLVKIYLTALPRSQFVLDDYMLLLDYLFQRYLPITDMRSEAEWLATRAVLMGRVQANLESISAEEADTVLAALPPTVAAAKQTFAMSDIQQSILDYTAAHAAENAQTFTDTMRHKLRRVILTVEEEHLAARPGLVAATLKTKLFDEFADLNRDWRRVAVTEAGEAANQGQVSSVPAGTKLQRVEMYRGACPFCRKIDGKVMEVVPADAPIKNGATQIWVGKTNMGRSAAPRKRVGTDLIEREPEERWWIPAGVVHPHCRGRWVPTIKVVGADPQFEEWLKVTLGERHAA